MWESLSIKKWRMLRFFSVQGKENNCIYGPTLMSFSSFPVSQSKVEESISSEFGHQQCPLREEGPLMLKTQWTVKEVKAVFISPSRA